LYHRKLIAVCRLAVCRVYPGFFMPKIHVISIKETPMCETDFDNYDQDTVTSDDQTPVTVLWRQVSRDAHRDVRQGTSLQGLQEMTHRLYGHNPMPSGHGPVAEDFRV
jgi:hypothetical protein